MDIALPKDPHFNKYYTKHCKYLKLKGLQPKTIVAYARALRVLLNYLEYSGIRQLLRPIQAYFQKDIFYR